MWRLLVDRKIPAPVGRGWLASHGGYFFFIFYFLIFFGVWFFPQHTYFSPRCLQRRYRSRGFGSQSQIYCLVGRRGLTCSVCPSPSPSSPVRSFAPSLFSVKQQRIGGSDFECGLRFARESSRVESRVALSSKLLAACQQSMRLTARSRVNFQHNASLHQVERVERPIASLSFLTFWPFALPYNYKPTSLDHIINQQKLKRSASICHLQSP